MTSTPDTAGPAQLARQTWGALDTLHVVGYFAPEPTAAYVGLGLHERLSYFAARSAAMGPVGPELTTATFFVFAPRLVGMALPAAWAVTDPAAVQQARRSGMAAALRRLLGEPDVTEAAELALEACRGLTPAGRPLYAAHSGLDVPDDPMLSLWHAATLVREHRGDGHVSVLTTAGLDPVQALVLSGRYDSSTSFLRKTRGWTQEEWTAAEEQLRTRGLLTDGGELTAEGRALRQRIEDDTDSLGTAAFDHLGQERTRRLHELLAPLRRTLLDSGELPGFIRGRG